MRINPVKAALKAGKTVYGSEISRVPCTEVVRIYAAAGFDFVFIDMEHTPFGLDTVAELIRAARATNVVPIVRVPQGEYAWVARVLDNGAQGIIVPRVNTRRHAEEIVSWTRYPPLGIRGFACTSAQADGQAVEPDAFMDAIHANTLVVIQIERREAIDNLEDMLSVEGVDVACLGYMDLSVDLGIPGQMEHPLMVEAIERLIAVARRNKVIPGIISPDLPALKHWIERGMRFVSHSTDAILLQDAAAAALRNLRSLSMKN